MKIQRFIIKATMSISIFVSIATSIMHYNHTTVILPEQPHVIEEQRLAKNPVEFRPTRPGISTAINIPMIPTTNLIITIN